MDPSASQEITCIELGSQLRYEFHHTIAEGESDQLDGQLTDGSRRVQLDISSLGDEWLSLEDAERAKAAWADGRVLMMASSEHHITSLVIPNPALTIAGITEALKRLKP